MSEHRHPSSGQRPLPFLAVEDVAAIDEACSVVDRQQQKSLMARRTAEAAEMGRLGDQLRRILENHATAYRGRQ